MDLRSNYMSIIAAVCEHLKAGRTARSVSRLKGVQASQGSLSDEAFSKPLERIKMH